MSPPIVCEYFPDSCWTYAKLKQWPPTFQLQILSAWYQYSSTNSLVSWQRSYSVYGLIICYWWVTDLGGGCCFFLKNTFSQDRGHRQANLLLTYCFCLPKKYAGIWSEHSSKLICGWGIRSGEQDLLWTWSPHSLSDTTAPANASL